MEHSQATYKSSKRRNQETLARIQTFENEIVRLEQEIRDKKKRTDCVRLYRDRCDRLIQRQLAYHAIMPSPLPWMVTKQRTPRLNETLKALEQHKVDPQDIVDLLSKDLIATLIQRVNQLELPGDALTRSKPRNDPSDGIHHSLRGRQRETESIYQECDVLQARANHLQKELRTRIRKLYSDVQVQSTYLKSIRTESESQSVTMQRKMLEEQVNSLQAEALMEASVNEVHTIEDTVGALVEKQRKVEEMLALSRVGARRLEKQREKYNKEDTERRQELLDRLDRECKVLHSSIKRKNDLFHLLPMTPGSNVEGKRDSRRLEQIKNALHPYLRLSQHGVLDVLGDVLTRVNALAASHSSEPDLRETFEAIATRWQQDLEQSNIDFKDPSADEDAVDTLINAASTFKKHSQREQGAFVSKQEKLLGSKLSVLKQAEVEVLSIIDAIEERKHIEDGSIGLDYTYRGRMLQEWLSSE